MAEQRRRRRWPWVLSVFALLLAIGAWYVNRQLEPNRLTAIVLQQAGESLQLKLQFQGQPDYALKPEPRLLIPNFSVSGKDGKVFLFAKRAEISLPWSTITGDEPVITRIELDQPKIDVPGLRRWIASRPPTPFKLPTLTKGLEISGGTVTDDSYAINKLDLKLPRLKTGEPAKASASGRFTQGATVVDFKVALGMKTPGLDSDFDLQGDGALQQSPEPQKFTMQLAGHFLSDDKAFSVDARALKFDGASPLPRLSGAGKFVLAENMKLDFDGLLLDWPKAWPALPEPLAANTKNLPIKVSYVGKSDLSDPLYLVVAREPTTLQAAVRTEQLREWVAATGGSPLPPLTGTLSTPSMKFDGVELQGVEIEISDGEKAGAPLP
jgi:hypothetical protein